ncbi:unnamed protein product [Lactuca virosa]|uniref:Uncharacterized protein n=1 Tax=Lactuca virosa TaxID=75947 RepID=A0AAU9PUK8_9ASTR|nr:unnamed protein product [Lactuca virosa]
MDSVIPDILTKSIGLTPLSSESTHNKPLPVPPNSSSKGASGADPLGDHKHGFRPSDSTDTSGIPPLSSPKKMYSISSFPKAPLVSLEAIVRPTPIQSDSLVISTKLIPSGSDAMVHLCRGHLAKLMFLQWLFNSFAPPTSDPPASTAALVVTPVVSISTEAPSDLANVINLDSLIPDMDVTYVNSAGPLPGSSSSELLPPPKNG